jgi:hypothetical protein
VATECTAVRHEVTDNGGDIEMTEIILNPCLSEDLTSGHSTNNDNSNNNNNNNNNYNSQNHDRPLTEVSLTVHVISTVLLWGSTLFIALISKKLGVVSALTGN